MNFKVKKIRKTPPPPPEPPRQTRREDPPKAKNSHTSRKLKISLPIFVSIGIIVLILFGTIKVISSIDFGFFLRIAGTDLKTDAFGHSNFLLLGTGGENHDGGDLTDTIIVASLDPEEKIVSMMSIPRDFYVKDDLIGNSRINEVYFNALDEFGNSSESIDYFKEKVEELTGTPIHYWAMIDFKGFEELVDAIGGIEIDVEQAIYDPFYPKDGTYEYEPFSISAGLQTIDGETALKYARSRKTTSDFDRSKRQQQIMYAIKDRMLQTEVIFSKEKIENILAAIKNNINTNLKIKEMLTLGSMAEGFSRDSIITRVIHDDPNYCGGFLYTPSRELYGGAFVLIPAGKQFIERYSSLNFNYSAILQENPSLHVLNGTKTGGVAGETKQILDRFCFDVARYGNGRNQAVTTTTYYYRQKYDENAEPIDSRPIALDFLQTLIPGEESTELPTEYSTYTSDLILEIGTDYVNSDDYIEDPFYYLVPVTPTETETDTETTTEDASE